MASMNYGDAALHVNLSYIQSISEGKEKVKVLILFFSRFQIVQISLLQN